LIPLSSKKRHVSGEKTMILHFSLEGILDPQSVLAVDKTNGIIAVLASRKGRSFLEASAHLTDNEIRILLPLLEAYPYYCPYEMLLASLLSGETTEHDIAHARERLEDALAEGTWDIEMRPVRNLLSRARIKFRELGVDIHSIIETGYILAKRRQSTR
jgi:DNA-binding response OmpR family regulator